MHNSEEYKNNKTHDNSVARSVTQQINQENEMYFNEQMKMILQSNLKGRRSEKTVQHQTSRPAQCLHV